MAAGRSGHTTEASKEEVRNAIDRRPTHASSPGWAAVERRRYRASEWIAAGPGVIPGHLHGPGLLSTTRSSSVNADIGSGPQSLVVSRMARSTGLNAGIESRAPVLRVGV
ncbi:MAG: hypothetical protein AW07_04773 [Candidatus Accumulibacter sp. SK-11]|nr:MAG: hypothetical protein AW07_04773 [Candidatus Accumulibacter sp. SK-11]